MNPIRTTFAKSQGFFKPGDFLMYRDEAFPIEPIPFDELHQAILPTSVPVVRDLDRGLGEKIFFWWQKPTVEELESNPDLPITLYVVKYVINESEENPDLGSEENPYFGSEETPYFEVLAYFDWFRPPPVWRLGNAKIVINPSDLENIQLYRCDLLTLFSLKRKRTVGNTYDTLVYELNKNPNIYNRSIPTLQDLRNREQIGPYRRYPKGGSRKHLRSKTHCKRKAPGTKRSRRRHEKRRR